MSRWDDSRFIVYLNRHVAHLQLLIAIINSIWRNGLNLVEIQFDRSDSADAHLTLRMLKCETVSSWGDFRHANTQNPDIKPI